LHMDADDAVMMEDERQDAELSKEQQAWVSKKIAKLRREGKPQKQAEAEAISMAKSNKTDVMEKLDAGAMVGMTSTSKPVYGSDGDQAGEFEPHKSNAGDKLTPAEHGEAATMHQQAAYQQDSHGVRAKGANGDDPYHPDAMFHGNLAREHRQAEVYHRARSQPSHSRQDSLPDKIKENIMTVKLKRQQVDAGELHLDELIVEVDEKDETMITTLLDRQDTILAHVGALSQRNDELIGQIEALKEASSNPDKLEEAARERSDIMDTAQYAGLKRDDLKSLSNDSVKRKIVAKKFPKLKLDDETSDGVVQGRYDVVLEQMAETKGNRVQHRDLANATRRDGADARTPEEERADEDLSPRERAQAKLKTVGRMSHDQLEDAYGIN